MKKILLLLSLLVLSCMLLNAQDTTRTAPVDSTLVGRNILSVMGSGATINQSATVKQALDNYVQSNAQKPITGYRVRVFYDNAPTARTEAESIVRSLRGQYPGIQVYLSFESPNYKVCIGDYRSKEEALQVYNSLKWTYPTAYIIKESINYPR